MAASLIIPLVIGCVGSMVSSSINAQNANKNKCANEKNMEGILQNYQEYNSKIQQFIDKDDIQINDLNNQIKAQQAELNTYKTEVNNHSANYKKYINNIYLIFGIFAGITIILCIIKVVKTKKYRHKLRRKYLESLN